MTTNQKMVWTIVGIIVLAVLGYWVYAAQMNDDADGVGFITNFEECAAAGYPVEESFPRRCRTPEGQVYEEARNAEEGPRVTGGCYVGGCSSQICSEEPDAVSTCEYRPEYACYRTATCGRQTDGSCGWIETEELNLCLSANLGELSK